jgi:disulfide bond formation protein DsbB
MRGGFVRHARRWGAVYILLLLFIGSWLGQFFAQLAEFRADQRTHHEPFSWSDFLTQFAASTFENWQSEWFQLIFQAILLLGMKHWLFQVDAVDMERLENKVDAIANRMGIDPNETSEPRPQQVSPESASE